MHCVALGESFQTHIYLQNLASIQPRTSPASLPDRAARDGAPGTTTPRGEVAPRLPARVAALRGRRVPEAGPAALRVLGAARARLRRRRGRVMKYFSYVQHEFQQVFLKYQR